MPKQYLVLTAVGTDRPGLVKDLSALLLHAGCNLEDSRMAILAGEFALIVQLSGDDAAITRATQATTELEQRLGLRITLTTSHPRTQQQPYELWQLRVSGEDQAGIVHAIGDVLASDHINIASLESRVTPAAFSGTPLFLLNAELQLPCGTATTSLQLALERVCERLGMQLEFKRQLASC